MTNEEIKEIAFRTTVKILEETAFIFTDPMEENGRPDPDSWMPEGVSLNFKGDAVGKLRMWAGDDFTRFAAANMLGIGEDEECASQKGLDALKEILNIVVGNLLTEVYSEELLFDLEIPQKLPKEELKNDLLSNNAIWLQAEGHPVLFVVEMNA